MGTTDANGLFVANLEANTVENDPASFLLVRDFTGAIGDDLDPTDTGTFTTTPWAELADSVSIQFGAGIAYSPTVLDEAFDDATVDSTFAPGGASRIPDGSGPWVRNDFDLSPILSGTPELGEAANTPGAPNELVDPIVVIPAVQIHEVQGSGATVALSGDVQVSAIVTSLFTDNDVLDGFFIQEPDAEADADPATSEGIFVFCRTNCPASLAVGDAVTVVGTPEDFFGMSQIDMEAGYRGRSHL